MIVEKERIITVSLNMTGRYTRYDIYRRHGTAENAGNAGLNRRPHFRFHASNNAIGICVSRTSGNCLVTHAHTHARARHENTK